jgi:chromosome segregation protein
LNFTRLRLSGFKSFVEPTELFIEPGLTAIVGPNGCGKSNLFDALRWVMGEARPTSVRGAEMDDVIFAGSATRPPRNVAEVILVVDNSDRTAPAPYNEFDTVEISRRIERDAGSVYRINGREQRQRDIQIFFADASSGAASTAFVRQGQIGLLISQKPLARRAILEEAAGIGGLHQRRHEAELRLRAAETNMSRLDDLLRELEGQLQNLKRQARQAARYRNISGLIRKAEALAHHLRWSAAASHLRTAQTSLESANANVADCTARAAMATTTRARVAGDLEPVRLAESERGAALHRLALERDALEQEETRSREAAQRQRQYIAQTGQDLAHERELDRDSGVSIAALAEENRSLGEAEANAAHETLEAESLLSARDRALADAERTLDRFTANLAEWNARTQSQSRAREIAAALKETSSQQLADAEGRLGQALAGSEHEPDIHTREIEVARMRDQALAARESLDRGRSSLRLAEVAESEARAPLEATEREEQRLLAEAKALADVLQPRNAETWALLIDAVKVEPGYEAALAATLGDDLEAPIDEAAPNHWRNLGSLDSPPPLPRDAKSLGNFVVAPPALARRLAMTAVIDAEVGAALQPCLRPGQRLVTLRGDLWRWDGFTLSGDAPSPAAHRLAQRNRLAQFDAEIAHATVARNEAQARLATAREYTEIARKAVWVAEQNERDIERALVGVQEAAATAARIVAERSTQLASFQAEIRRLTAARDAARDATENADAALAELGDGLELSSSTSTAREHAAEARTAHMESRAALESLRRESEIRARRLAAIDGEVSRWQNRRDAAQRQIVELDRRFERLHCELQALEAAPGELAERRQALISAIAQAESARADAADIRVIAESTLAAADKAAKAAEAELAAAREARARFEAMEQSAHERLSELETRIRDELEMEPASLAAHADIKREDELPSLEHAEKRVEKLKNEREQLGGVNLRAEDEATEAGQRLDGLARDRADLDGAIQRLRRGIQSLNREGRDRLLESFDKVNANFQLLFAKLFDGGEAKLTLTESDDPLEAGLEIYARPPGKRLQSLSLLSGGEQALTALALILAVFLVNPAPVCVLDEVDAPLDDANVDRFCNLLDEMRRLATTRFIVITHHALTMSRVDRLFGVTMAERGVSQLVSVTLAEAEHVAAAE